MQNFAEEDQNKSQQKVATIEQDGNAVNATVIETDAKVGEALVKKPWINSAKEIMEMGVTEIPMLAEGLFPKYGMAVLAGSSDLGKSYLLLQLADAVINGSHDFLGFRLNAEHKRVIYISTEDDEYSICPRLINLSKNTEDKSVYNRLEIITSGQNLLEELDKLLTANPTDLVIADTLSDLYSGDMNQSNKVRFFLNDYKELARKHKTLFVFNHHCGKKNDFRPPHKDNLLGSQGIESSNRTVIELRKDFADQAIRHLCIVKANHLDENSKNRSYGLRFDYRGDGFTNTGVRVPFEQLAKPENNDAQRSERDERILALRAEGNSITQITAKMQEEGIDIGRTTVGNICKANPSIQPPIEEKADVPEKTTVIDKEVEILNIQSFLKVPITYLKFDTGSVQIFSNDIDLGAVAFSIVAGAVHYENLHQIETRVNWEKVYARYNEMIKSEIMEMVNRQDYLTIHSTDFRECDICTDTKNLFTVVCEFVDGYWSFAKKSGAPTLF